MSKEVSRSIAVREMSTGITPQYDVYSAFVREFEE